MSWGEGSVKMFGGGEGNWGVEGGNREGELGKNEGVGGREGGDVGRKLGEGEKNGVFELAEGVREGGRGSLALRRLLCALNCLIRITDRDRGGEKKARREGKGVNLLREALLKAARGGSYTRPFVDRTVELYGFNASYNEKNQICIKK